MVSNLEMVKKKETPKSPPISPSPRGTAAGRGEQAAPLPRMPNLTPVERASPSNRYHYNPRLKHLARRLRNQSTKAEVYIWMFLLRARGFRNYSFNRQRPVLNYIADFMCKELMLIIEIDGSIHERWDVKKKDEIRQRRLEEAGFTVLRFTNDQALYDRKGVEQALTKWLLNKNARW